MSKRNILIIIDAVRKDSVGNHFKFLNSLDYVISTGNRTPFPVHSMLSGKNVDEIDLEWNWKDNHIDGHMLSNKDGKSTMFPCLFDLFNKHIILQEMPEFELIWGRHGDYNCHIVDMNINKTLSQARQFYEENKEEYFIFIHLKAGHNPYLYTGNIGPTYNYLSKYYQMEVDYTLKVLERFVKSISYDNIVICADHGEGLWDYGEIPSHGVGFSKTIVNVPFWTNKDIDNTKLYSISIVNDIFMENKIIPKQFVISTSPSNVLPGKYQAGDRGKDNSIYDFGISTLVDGDIVTKEFSGMITQQLKDCK